MSYNRARTIIDQGRLKDAELLLEESLKQMRRFRRFEDPAYGAGIAALSNIKMTQGDLDSAEKLLSEGTSRLEAMRLQGSKSHTVILRELARLRLHQGRREEGLILIDKALSIAESIDAPAQEKLLSLREELVGE